MGQESSFQQGFGGGCGLILGIMFAVFIVPLIGMVSCIALGVGVAVNSDRSTKAVANPVASADTQPTDTQDAVEEQQPPAATPPIDRLNLANYARVEMGMTYDQVKAIIGPASEELASSEFGAGTEFAVQTVMLTWNGSWGANAIISFQNGRAAMKTQAGLPNGEVTPDYVDPHTLEMQRREEQARAEFKEQDEASRKAEQERKETEEAAMWRTWTDATGNHKIEARYSGRINNLITLKKRDGTVKKVPLEKLSEKDQEWIKNKNIE